MAAAGRAVLWGDHRAGQRALAQARPMELDGLADRGRRQPTANLTDVGAMYSGFTMVVLLAAAVRWGFRLQSLITVEHFEVMAKILLAASLIMTVSYATEWFGAWYGGETAERRLVAFEFNGDYRALYYTMLFLNCALAQAFWFPGARRNIPVVVTIGVLINIGMWLERITIVLNTLSHGYSISMWESYGPTFWEYALMFGSTGLFALLYLLLCRLVPMVSIHETLRLLSSPEIKP